MWTGCAHQTTKSLINPFVNRDKTIPANSAGARPHAARLSRCRVDGHWAMGIWHLPFGIHLLQ